MMSKFVALHAQEFPYALGVKGATKRKLSAAAGCIIEFVGHVAVLCGTKEERERGGKYLGE
jgi:hypothetical protein